MKNSTSIVKEEEEPSLLDLCEAIIELILELLSAADLRVLSEVCISLRDICRKDSLWKKLIDQKWGKLIGDAIYQEWKWHMIARKIADQPNIQKPTLCPFYGAWPNLSIGSHLENNHSSSGSFFGGDSMMALYISLERGRFWFPAEVYQDLRHYGALVSYDSRTDTFRARERHGWALMDENVEWDMVRMAASPPSVLHVSDCLEDLKPGDHIEIQWRSSKEIPYDWWYAVIGHLRSCNEQENACRCQYSDTLIVEFIQYSTSSRMRKVELSRKKNEEQESGGFYGGIRRLGAEEIETWKKLWQQYEATFHVEGGLI